MRMAARSARVLLVAAILLMLGACGPRGGGETVSLGNTVPALPELERALMQEFERLGIDPDKTTAAAPGGAENVIFDLACYVTDPDGPGGNSPTEVRLTWTEQAVGDYDQNGEVGISDLTPLGAKFNGQVQYDPPELHDGRTNWPTGSFVDGGGVPAGSPPATGSGAENWRLARIDGDANGELNISDITPIASHWNDRLDGCRVYRFRPGDTSFQLLPNPTNPGEQYTIARPITPSGWPARYTFVDTDLAGAPGGWYEYYVVQYCATDNLEGTPSNLAGADLDAGGGGGWPPIAILSSDVQSGAASLIVNFTAVSSYDPDGTITQYEWTIAGAPGGWVSTGTTPTQQITYTTAGVKTMSVRVTDDDGHTSVDTMKISVSQPGGNLPPLAYLSGSPPWGITPVQATWDASNSFDHDGTIAKYEWDMDEDPLNGFESDSGTTPTLQITYNTAGVKEQWVQVTDDGGLTDTAMATLIVEDTSGNIPPHAEFTVSPSEGDKGVVVNFDATASYDMGGNIQQYEWDYDGDMVYDQSTAIPTTTHTYNTPGIIDPVLRVTDDVGATDTDYQRVTVHGWVTSAVDSNLTIVMGPHCSAAVVNGYPAIAYQEDNFPTYQSVRYVQAINAQGTAWNTPVTVQDGSTSGNYLGTDISLAVVNGNPAIGYADGTAFTLHFIRANDQDGTGWPATAVTADPSGNGANYISLAILNGNPAISYQHIIAGGLICTRATDVNGTGWGAGCWLVAAATGAGTYSTLLDFTDTILGTLPIIGHRDSGTDQAAFVRATDTSTSGGWNVSFFTSPANLSQDRLSMAIVNGVPAQAHYGTDTTSGPGLYYHQCSYLQGTWVFDWTTSLVQVLGGVDDGKDCCLAVIGGVPAIASTEFCMDGNNRMTYVTAQDVNGIAWNVSEQVEPDLQVDNGCFASLIDLSGHPGIAHFNNAQSTLWFSYRY